MSTGDGQRCPTRTASCRWSQQAFATRRPFASFLPGIAGTGGIPLWVFTVNRGQGIAAMGVTSKDTPILEFQPASRAWLDTERTGFRTFVSVQRMLRTIDVEPFGPHDERTTWTSGLNTLDLRASHEGAGIDVDVSYCTVSDEPFAGLVRRVTFRNTGVGAATLSVLDGIARLIPFGVDDGVLKGIGRTVEAWMQVEDAESTAPFFHLTATTGDAAEVTAIAAGHFYCAPGAARVLVDPRVVFGEATGLGLPIGFHETGWDGMVERPQVTQGRTPCALAAHRFHLSPGAEHTITAVVGHAPDRETLASLTPRLTDAWASAQRVRAEELGEALTDPIAITTADPRFDAYARQTYLDNVLRGGEPLRVGGTVLHVHGRKHGDLERDYNAFRLPPTPLSEGNANYRDLNQNRRCDVLFHPWVGATNVLDFLGCLGLDGYNPLVLTGRRFMLDAAARADLAGLTQRPDAVAWPAEFIAGELLMTLRAADLGPGRDPDTLLAAAIGRATVRFAAEFGEGYWVDHWIYNLDHLDSFRAVFPDRWADLLATDVGYAPAWGRVPGRDERFVLTERGVRQYAHVTFDPDAGGAGPGGSELVTSVFAKLVGLAFVKAATFDPAGLGLEMEGGRPGWYDALNGLPGLLGSSLGEVRELRRLLRLLADALADGSASGARVPVEVADLVAGVVGATLEWSEGGGGRDLVAWRALAAVRDGFRARTARGVEGPWVTIAAPELAQALAVVRDRVDAAIAAAEELPVGTMYARFEVDAHEPVGTTDAAGRPHVRPLSFRPVPLPVFLEGAVHALVDAPTRAAEVHAAVLAGPLYDEPLGMFRVNASLADESHEIGRARAFTPGWLENESIWLHMEYKYLLGLLRAGEVEAFHAAFARAGVHVQDEGRYGRSPFENSSFLVSSAHPDPSLHGQGFVARLSGATAEFCSIWHLLTAGPTPFVLDEGELVCRLRPALPADWFDADDRVRFTFVGSVPVTVHNPRRVDTWASAPPSVTLVMDGEQHVGVAGDVRGRLAEALRDGRVEHVTLAY